MQAPKVNLADIGLTDPPPSFVDLVARTAHEVNRAVQAFNDETVSEPWDDAPELIKDSSRMGVHIAVATPDVTPEMMHAKWCEHKRAEGWTYAATKDMNAKTHPCLVEYAALPAGQRLKDATFLAVVAGVLGHLFGQMAIEASPGADERDVVQP